jgi:hypothetical protein
VSRSADKRREDDAALGACIQSRTLSPSVVAVQKVGFPCHHAGLRTQLVDLSPLSPGDKPRERGAQRRKAAGAKPAKAPANKRAPARRST